MQELEAVNKRRSYFARYQSISAPVKASFWFTVCNVLQKGIAVITTPIFTRLMTTDQYGKFTIYQSWFCIISIFATLNLPTAIYNNALTKYENTRSQVTSSFLGLTTTLSLMIFLIYFPARDFWNNQLGLSTFLMLLMFAEIILEIAFQFWMTQQRYDFKYKKVILFSLFITILVPILGVIFIINTTYKAEARILSYVLVEAGVGLLFYIHIFFKGKKFVIVEYWKYALLLSLPLIPHFLATTVLAQADRIMISKMVGNGEAAIYSVAYTIATVMLLVSNAINSSFIPYTYKELKSGNYQEIGKKANFLLVLVGAFCVLAMAVGPELVLIIGGSKYYSAKWVVPPVSASVFFLFAYQIYVNIEMYYEKTKLIMIASIAAAVSNIVMNLFLIRIFGYIAAAYTTLICYMMFAVIHFIFYKKIVLKQQQIKDIYNNRAVLIYSLVLLGIMVLLTALYQWIYLRGAVLLAVATVLCIKRNKIISAIRSMSKKSIRE